MLTIAIQLRVAFFGRGTQRTSTVTPKAQTPEEGIGQGLCQATENVDQVGKSTLGRYFGGRKNEGKFRKIMNLPQTPPPCSVLFVKQAQKAR